MKSEEFGVRSEMWYIAGVDIYDDPYDRNEYFLSTVPDIEYARHSADEQCDLP